ncbi:BREX system ATP-binding domain-containing protein [Methanosphaera sp. BMS]|uniref:BREX system ATP-binding domain-containing protein n=1 Tax=Methanosphaera sp. BMS TaxID=1789762 RepID=UPI000DC1D53C|nr:BREX system ATP-binding domain-containing protein [Methanosphaera sp. BMS]AWX31850.1 hypothetical protein AW729_01530 [Methanosphaera sp. BMS]
MDYQDTLNALKNGNIPRESILDFSVGREDELNEFKNILDRVENGTAVTKFINGEFGAGKSFFLKLIEETAFNDNFVVSRITLSQNLQFHKIENIYKEIAKTLKCKTGESLNHIIDRWITRLKVEAEDEYEDDDEIEERQEYLEHRIKEDLIATRDCSNSFATAIEKYFHAREEHDDETANYAQAWLRGDSNIPFTEKKKFGVKGDVTKENAFHFLTALSTFINSIGYSGLIILVDEAEFILKTPLEKSRSVAYNYMRDIYDNCNNGTFNGMLFVFAGTQQFYEDEKKGVKSYDALYSRIVNVLESDYDDLRTPIVNLHGFKENDVKKISDLIIDMHQETYQWDISNAKEAVSEFIDIRVANTGLTGGVIVPRTYIRELISVLDTVEQNQEQLNNKEEIIKLFKEEENSIETEEEIFDDW